MKNFGEKEAWAYPGAAPNFLGIPYYLINGKCYGFQIWLVYSKNPLEQKPIKNFGEEGAAGSVDVSMGLSNFFGYPLLSQERSKLGYSNFARTLFYRLDRNKSPLKISGKVAMGIVRDSRNFSGHPCIGRIARSSLRQLSFLVKMFCCVQNIDELIHLL